MTTQPCPFCSLSEKRVLGQNAHALWIRDGFPISQGHSLVIPKRHVGSFFDISSGFNCDDFSMHPRRFTSTE
ncbi:HIT family protein [Hydrogenophaga taeniospiralis]|uniref:HIT family protein n=1 Tax=Hydrogenophaga taeniospiralis TaxID=65656 RepID=UPI001CFA4B3E|nr:HIT domain-containing protein [Hydrogenophaga taeniospiralis]UCU96331.1 HIT domain-containing protein [Hydrogenophaga taeniospiralis]